MEQNEGEQKQNSGKDSNLNRENVTESNETDDTKNVMSKLQYIRDI